MRSSWTAVVVLATVGIGVGAPLADAQEPAPRITLIELTPHIAVNDAAALIEAEKYRDAVVILDGFIANQPEQVPEAFYLLGLAHYKLGDYAKARMPAERAATLAPDAPVSWLELVADILKRSDQPRAAIAWLDRLIEKAPGTKVYWLELSVAYEKVGDFERSLATMRLANVHITRRDWSAAVAALHAGMGKGRLTDEAHANLLMGVALYAQGKFDEAREWLTTAAQSDRHRAMARSYLEAIDARTASR